MKKCCRFPTSTLCGEDGAIFYENGKISVRELGQESITPKLPEQTSNQDKSFVDAIFGRHEVLIPGSFVKEVVRLTEMAYAAGEYD